MHSSYDTPVVVFAGYSGSGKTTLLKKLIQHLQQRGIRIGMIKHAHHDFDIDKPGKDSYELRKAGASQMLVASDQRWALVSEEKSSEDPPPLAQLVNRLDHKQLDLIMVEGYKYEAMEKIEIKRKESKGDWLFPNDKNIIAIVSDMAPLHPLEGRALFSLEDIKQLADFVCDRYLANVNKQ